MVSVKRDEVRESLGSIRDDLGIHRLFRGVDNVRGNGDPDSRPTQSGFNAARTPHGNASSQWGVVSPAARHLDRPLRGPPHHAASPGGLRRPTMDIVLCDRALAVSAAWPGARAGWRLFLGWDALCGALLSKGEPGIRHGILWGRHHWGGAEHVRRAISGRPLWLAIRAEGLRGRSPGHCRAVLVLLRP